MVADKDCILKWNNNKNKEQRAYEIQYIVTNLKRIDLV